MLWPRDVQPANRLGDNPGIPARGSADVLPRALESIEDQTYPNVLEVVVAAADYESAAVAEAAGATVVDNEVGFTRNQDYELNHRLTETGDIVGFDPELRVQYRPRGSPPSWLASTSTTGTPNAGFAPAPSREGFTGDSWPHSS